jgi:hypothetical protein
MDVVDRGLLARQLRGVEIVDLVGAGIVEQIEDVEPQLRLLGKFVADPKIDERSGAISKVTRVPLPAGAASNPAAAAVEFGKGMPGSAPGSAAVKITGAASAPPPISASAVAAATMVRAFMLSSFQ